MTLRNPQQRHRNPADPAATPEAKQRASATPPTRVGASLPGVPPRRPHDDRRTRRRGYRQPGQPSEPTKTPTPPGVGAFVIHRYAFRRQGTRRRGGAPVWRGGVELPASSPLCARRSTGRETASSPLTWADARWPLSVLLRRLACIRPGIASRPHHEGPEERASGRERPAGRSNELP